MRRRDDDSNNLAPQTIKKFDGDGWHVSLYAPWWASQRSKRELGFMVRVRDPRGACDHHGRPRWATEADSEGVWRVWCGSCGQRLPVKNNKVKRPQGSRWRWLKVYVARTQPGYARAHGVVLAEAETHITQGVFDRLTVKAFVRLKLGFGGPWV